MGPESHSERRWASGDRSDQRVERMGMQSDVMVAIAVIGYETADAKGIRKKFDVVFTLGCEQK